SNTIVRNYQNNSDNFNGSASLRYNSLRQLLMGIYNFYNINIGLNNTVSFSRNTVSSNVQDLDSITNRYVTNDYLTNDNTLNTFSYAPGLYLSKDINKNVWSRYNYYLNFTASLDHRWLSQ